MKAALWKPSLERIKNSNMQKFMNFVGDKYGRQCENYSELHEWSVENLENFWAAVWEFTEIKSNRPYTAVLENPEQMPGARWFPGAKLNFAENLLRFRDERTALIYRAEDQFETRLTYAELYRKTAALSRALRGAGVGPGDRVAGFMPNMPETVIAMLAATAIGAVWSSCSPDFGKQGVLDRFGQIKARVLFSADGYFFKGKKISSLERVAEISRDIPSLETVIIIPHIEEAPDLSAVPSAQLLSDFTAAHTGEEDIEFEYLPFDHPVYIMYSSGTTGLPKCMVQGAGVLLNHLKEHVLHADLKREDVTFYYTTCGWMMWNWLVSALATGATLVLYDGNPLYPDGGALWKMAEELNINIFGTSARWIKAVEDTGLRPGDEFSLESIRTILSTGSPLPPEGFEFVYDAVKKDVQLASIAGGTDLNGCFALGNPLQAVYAGQIQGPGLGMKTEIFNDAGQSVREEKGELVCTRTFPSMPLHFWQDEDGQKYHKAYFDVYPNIWRHGDFAEITAEGGFIFYGRSDATLNPGGVRIGTADIYSRLETMPEIEDSVIVGQSRESDVRIILFVKLKPDIELTEELIKHIKADIRSKTSPRHVPAIILSVPDIPYTLNMKKVELAVKNVIEGRAVTNRDALRNPEALEYYKDLPELE